MKHNYLTLLLLTISFFCFAQTTILHSGIDGYITISDIENIPTITNNNDGTITLTHREQYITDIFANYEIYDFYLTSPETSQNKFTINFKSKDLINELVENVPSEIFFSRLYPYQTSEINQDMITALDGVSFDILKYLSNPDYFICGDCPPYNVSDDFKLSVTFNYNGEKDIFYMKSNSISPCGNEFSIGLKGGDMDNGENNLQIWESNSVTSTPSNDSQPCHNIEQTLYLLLGIHNNRNSSGYFKVSVDPETNHLKLLKDDSFGFYFIEFSEVNLSTEDEFFKQMIPFQNKETPYLQISNTDNQNISIEIHSITGQKIIDKKVFKNNSINISSFKNGLYLIRLSDTNNQQKVFKFIKK